MKNEFKDLALGPIVRMQLTSIQYCYGLQPYPDQMLRQKLTLHANGKVKFKQTIIQEVYGQDVAEQQQQMFSVPATVAQYLLVTMRMYFAKNGPIKTKHGMERLAKWQIKLTDAKGKTVKFYGPMLGDDLMLERHVGLSNLLRQYLANGRLLAFDGVIRTPALPQIGELVFVKVKFSDEGKTYCYLSDDPDVQVGDWVEVPVGSYGDVKKVRVAKVETHDPSDAPYPVEKCKHILRVLKD